ncbi:MAG TPA: lytic transglycosylase domain-containing protein [Candidatus Methylomirabilis sp.]|nr:lytic transglycosylase domain-containing protein [Candidatus Methylomirabilis sp.]
MRRAVALVCLFCSLGTGGLAQPAEPPNPPVAAPAALGLTPESRDRFVTALGLLKAGDSSSAATEFGDRGWSSTPLADYALLFQAQGLMRSGDAAGARAAAQRAAGGPDSPLAASAVAQAASVLSSAGDPPGAIALYHRFLTRYGDHPDVPAARLALAQALLADGRTADAARTLSDLWLLSPASAEAESAAKQLRVLADQGLAVPAPGARERIERAERLLAAGLGDAAQAEAEALLPEPLPADLRGRALKVVFEACRRSGRNDAAASTVSRALSSLPPASRPPWLLELARLNRRRNRDLALSTLDTLTRDYPRSPEVAEAQLTKGQLLEDAAKPSEAQAVYRRLAAAYPEEPEGATALWRLGWFAWLQGGYTQSVSDWQQTLQSRGGRNYRDAAVYWIARAEELQGGRERAAQRFAQLQSEAPRSYYGILAAQRSARAQSPPARPSTAAVALPVDPLTPLLADPAFSRVEALRAVGLGTFADEEMAEMTRRALGDPKLLYALSAAYAQESRYHLALRILRRHFWSLSRAETDAAPRAFWEMFYPLGWRSELTAAAGRASVDPLFVAAVVREESSFYPRARSRVGARGLMQLMPDTAREIAQARRLAFAGPEALDDPAANLDLGAAYLSTLLRDFGDERVAVAAYNAGPARVREWWGARRSEDLEVWVEQIPYDETRAFVKRVMLSRDEYRRLYGETAAPGPAGNEPAAARDGTDTP